MHSRDPIRLLLHPGHAKCGSSSIQAALTTNALELRKRGVFVPERRANAIFNNASAGGDFATVERAISQLARRARRMSSHTVVLSAEHLASFQLVTTGRPIHQTIARHFGQVDLIYYVRRQDDWLVSMWQQSGHRRGYTLNHFIADALDGHRPNYRVAVECFQAIYGFDRVEVVPLVPEALSGGDLITDFSERAGFAPLPVRAEDRRRNVSMSGYLCDVLSRLQHIDTVGREQSVKRLLERNSRSKSLLFNSDKRILSLARRREVLSHFQDDNRALHEQCFSTIPFQRVFGLPEGPVDLEQTLRDELDGLKDVVAVQMDLLLSLLAERERSKMGRVAGRMARLRQRLRRFGR